ncbi:MAG: hypothetical protein IB618_01150 [Candidatus Pacearchaeota archaeon]|nr:MAG: hypothetical protein IB618_01150 [Candidatus Pacearchaeota archaeon]
MESEFNYEDAKARVSKELTDLVEQIWPEIKKSYEESIVQIAIPENKVKAIYTNCFNIKDDNKRKRFSMLFNLEEECYWHAIDNWPEIRKTLTKEDEKFYATLMIEEAKKRQHEEERFGYMWIVINYDNGNLQNFISEEFLEEVVNRGFWEIANGYFTGGIFSLPLEKYYTLMKYSKYLDFSRLDEFKDKPLVQGQYGWLDYRYIEVFERERKKLSLEDSAWFARPIIESVISWSLSFENPEDNPKEGLKKKLEPYKKYLNIRTIQDLLKEKFQYYIKYINDEDAGSYLGYANILIDYINLSEDEITRFVSASLPKEEFDLERTLIEINFPKKWLNSETMSIIQEKIIKHLDRPPYHWKGKQVIPHLGFLQDVIQREWLDEDIGKERIKKGLENYLTQKHRPGGAPVLELLQVLNPKHVEQKLYREVVHQSITDLVKRKRIEEASAWYKKAEQEGWLDKNKIPIFELS